MDELVADYGLIKHQEYAREDTARNHDKRSKVCQDVKIGYRGFFIVSIGSFMVNRQVVTLSVILSLLDAVQPFGQVAMSDEAAHQDQDACPVETALKLEVVENLSEDGPNHHPHADGGFAGTEYLSIIFGETNCDHGEH